MSAKMRAYSSYLGLTLTLLLALGAVFLVSTNWGSGAASAAHLTEPTIAQRAARLLGRIGLDPTTLTAASASSQQAATIATAALGYVADHGDALDQLIEDSQSARGDVSSLERRIRDGTDEEGDVTALASARIAAASAQEDLDTALAAAFATLTEGLGGTIQGRIQTIHAHRKSGVPVQYRCVTRTEAQWVALRSAWLQSQAALRAGAEPSQATATFLNGCGSDSDVVAAKSALDNNLASVTTAWQNALAAE